MAVKFFGQFLVEKGTISREQLLQAISLQESVNRSVGDVAVALGFMTDKDVVRVNQAQRSEDKRFGDLAIDLGILTGDQLQQILAEQKKSHLYIGEALVRVGAFSAEALTRHLEEFKADQAGYAVDHVTLPAGVPHADFCAMAADLTGKLLLRIARLTFHVEGGVVADRPAANQIGAAITISGDVTAQYAFTASRSIQLKIAAAMLGETDVSAEPQEILDDTIMEFVNVVVGNIVAKAAQLDLSLEIAPPFIVENYDELRPAPGQTGISFPIVLPDGERAELFLVIR